MQSHFLKLVTNLYFKNQVGICKKLLTMKKYIYFTIIFGNHLNIKYQNQAHTQKKLVIIIFTLFETF